MPAFTQREAKIHLNSIAKREGYYLKKHKHTINNHPAYFFEDRQSGRVIIGNMLFWSAYEKAVSCTYNKDLYKFDYFG